MQILKILTEVSEQLANHSGALVFNLDELSSAIMQTAGYVHQQIADEGDRCQRSRESFRAAVEETRAAMGETCDALLTQIEGAHVAQIADLKQLEDHIEETLRGTLAAIGKIRAAAAEQTMAMPAASQLESFPGLHLVEKLEGDLARDITPAETRSAA